MAVYLLHSTVPLTRESGREVRHYLGWCPEGEVRRRIADHQNNRHSARLVQALLKKGGKLMLGNYFPERTRDDERRMKVNGHLERLCLWCEHDDVCRRLAELPQ